MSNMTKARRAIQRVADRLDDVEAVRLLRRAIALTYRRTPVQRTKPRSRPITAALRDRVKRYHAQHPDASQQSIGDKFEINQGRVSQIVNGEYDYLK